MRPTERSARDRSAFPARSALLHSLGVVGFFLILGVAGCQVERGEARPSERLAVVDSVLSELGGEPTRAMNRGQRWRMISSMGAGLPPSSFRAEDLPDPASRGAVLLQAYCERCHGLPAPQMHAAGEWPILLRRMLMRARTLQARMGGPMTTELMGEILLTGMASADLPTEDERTVMLEYLQGHALPTASPGALGDDEAARPFVEGCSQCHETPSPTAHTAEEWRQVVGRMQANAALMDVPPLPDADADRIVSWLEAHAAG